MTKNFLWENFSSIKIKANTIVFDESGYNENLSMQFDEGIKILENKKLSITISENLSLPLHIINASKSEIEIKINKNISLELLESITKSNNLKIICEENSKLNFILASNVKTASTFNLKISAGNNSFVKGLGFFENKNNFAINYILGAESDSEIDIKNLVHNHNQIFTDINAENKNNNSSISVITKLIAFEKSESELKALSYIPKNLSGAKNNIIFNCLSDKKINRLKITPAQDINSIDIEATHGMSFGSYNKNYLWYLMSFGIRKESAYLYLLNAFENDIFEQVEEKTLMEEIKKFMED